MKLTLEVAGLKTKSFFAMGNEMRLDIFDHEVMTWKFLDPATSKKMLHLANVGTPKQSENSP